MVVSQLRSAKSKDVQSRCDALPSFHTPIEFDLFIGGLNGNEPFLGLFLMRLTQILDFVGVKFHRHFAVRLFDFRIGAGWVDFQDGIRIGLASLEHFLNADAVALMDSQPFGNLPNHIQLRAVNVSVCFGNSK